jgi:hypothetical protein
MRRREGKGVKTPSLPLTSLPHFGAGYCNENRFLLRWPPTGKRQEGMMRQFEYRILQAVDLSESVLNELGTEGWELVCSTQSIVYGSCLVLKREKVQ